MNKDYRLKENRMEYFTALYEMNLEHKVMPGLVYLYLPELAKRYGWDEEQKLWFATINGCTQNPITSLRIFNKYPEIPSAGPKWMAMDEWFNAEWAELQFDTDRRYQKKDTVKALHSYSKLVRTAGSQVALWSNKSYSEYWNIARSILSFGRLSAFSYLEYVNIYGYGADCDNLVFNDKSGSKSHRNGMFFLLGMDNKVWDKRQPDTHSGEYPDFKVMCAWLETEAERYLKTCGLAEANKFTFESNLCTTKNHYFGRRAPGSYADMAWERILWHDSLKLQKHTEVFKEIRQSLPSWLRMECSDEKLSIAQKSEIFAKTGYPHRGEFFLTE